MGDGALSAAVAAYVTRRDHPVRRLRQPSDRELTRALANDPAFVAVVTHDDVQALRWALVVEHARPGVRLLVTIFDRTVASQIQRVVPNCDVVSLADASVPALAAACLDPGLLLIERDDRSALALDTEGAIAEVPAPRPSRLAQLRQLAASQLWPYDASSRILLTGVLGMVALLVIDTVIVVAALDHGPLDAMYEAVRTATTVGPNRAADDGPGWYRLLTTIFMLLSTGLVALFTAGIVNRQLDRRLVAIVGRRTLPRSSHVIVVGLGQVGLRLCLQLRRLGVNVVAVERDANAPLVHLANRLGVPVVIGDGGERGLLERLGARRARTVAAVTSCDQQNIAVAVAALAAHDEVRVVLRAGDGDVVAESRALFAIGTVCDVTRIAAAHLGALALDGDIDAAFERDGALVLRRRDGTLIPA